MRTSIITYKGCRYINARRAIGSQACYGVSIGACSVRRKGVICAAYIDGDVTCGLVGVSNCYGEVVGIVDGVANGRGCAGYGYGTRSNASWCIIGVALSLQVFVVAKAAVIGLLELPSAGTVNDTVAGDNTPPLTLMVCVCPLAVTVMFSPLGEPVQESTTSKVELPLLQALTFTASIFNTHIFGLQGSGVCISWLSLQVLVLLNAALMV